MRYFTIKTNGVFTGKPKLWKEGKTWKCCFGPFCSVHNGRTPYLAFFNFLYNLEIEKEKEIQYV